ncbi:MAG: CHAP domain-containing protein [Rhodococcus sp.]|nr:CHAP domain-containing protein [Rhodococcus sp. (in: high G+C Gram-positive bacteria)]
METTAPHRRFRLLWVGAVLVAVLAIVVAVTLWWAPSRYMPWNTAAFPEIDRSTLTAQQAQVVDVLEAEHGENRPGTYYSEGVEQPWCANFVSWVMREAGSPLANPHSGHWRIPGVYTLQEYYQSVGRFEPAGSGYIPAVGDVVLYENVAWVGQHTNFIIAVDGDTAVTVGGNEMGKIRVHTLDLVGDSAVFGFGRLT